MIDELLARIHEFGPIPQAHLTDLEEAVGPIFADIDDPVESTTEIHRPQAFAKGAFVYASIHGRHLRITQNDPITIGGKKLVLRDGLAVLLPDERVLAVGDADKIEGKHVEIRSHRGWTDETGFTPLIRRLSLRMRYDSVVPAHRRDDRELLYVNLVLASPMAPVLAKLGEGREPPALLEHGRHALHPFYVSEIRADRTRVEWFSELPAFAKHP